MKKHNIWIKAGLFLAAGGSVCINAQAGAILNVNLEGHLLGASNVNVAGTLYDVSFSDGSCQMLFSGCDDPSDFIFAIKPEEIDALERDSYTRDSAEYLEDFQIFERNNQAHTVCLNSTPVSDQLATCGSAPLPPSSPDDIYLNLVARYNDCLASTFPIKKSCTAPQLTTMLSTEQVIREESRLRAKRASQALVDQVLIDSQDYLFDSVPGNITGCLSSFQCTIHTAFEWLSIPAVPPSDCEILPNGQTFCFKPGSPGREILFSVNATNRAGLAYDFARASNPSRNYDYVIDVVGNVFGTTTNYGGETWAVWSLAAGAASVSAPKILGACALSLCFIAWRRKNFK